MKKLMMMFAVAAAVLLTGCSVTKVNYERNDKGEVSYRLYRNSHWLKTEGEGMRGGMSENGKFEFDLEGMRSSPSEEFNRTMMTYTSAFIQLAQIAAAAYNPSASAAVKGEGSKAAQSTIILEQPKQESKPAIEQVENGIMLTTSQSAAVKTAASDPHAEECADGSCTTGACTDGACKP